MHDRRTTLMLIGCAWVLWSQILYSDNPDAQTFPLSAIGPQWSVVDAFESQGACESARSKKLQKALTSYLEVFKGTLLHQSDDTISVKGPSGETMMEFMPCLPDTVDPRPR